MNGFMGKLLFVNLSTMSYEVRDLDEQIAKDYLGGVGLGARILYEEMPANTPAFAPESMIGFVCGTMNGTGALMACRYNVVHKSPVYEGWNDANSGGGFGPALRRAGYDAVFVKGIAEKPVYIFIDNGEVEFRSAEKYWGTTTVTQFEAQVAEELGKKICAASIGLGGEQKKRTAAVMNDGHRCAARGGPGAVMGSKNLKAIVCCGTCKFPIADKDALMALNKEVMEWQKEGPVKPVVDTFFKWGTGSMYESSVLAADASVRNWAGSPNELREETLKDLTSERMDTKYKKKKFACFACPVGCGAIYDVKEKNVDMAHTGRPEYETTGTFGSQMLCDDPVAINICNTLCNEAGLDTISVGGTVAWAMECYEAGILSKEELDGIELNWGNAQAACQMTEKICKCEGIGALLAEGSAYAAKTLGKGEECLVTASGIEFPQHDPRLGPPLARTYKFDPAPGRHTKSGIGSLVGSQPPEYKNFPDVFAEDDVRCTCQTEIRTNGGFCEFTGFGLVPGGIERYINAATGFDMSPEDFQKAGARAFMIRHAFNLRDGRTRKDTTMSKRILGIPPLEEGPLAGITIDVEKMGDNFYRLMGCDNDGVPYKETLESLGGMDLVIRDLYPEG